ncbi:MAG: DEAD/DEAH box helicase [Chloroflexota bacterium]|nr:DEAD/DEAH box helicase [Chloroflexota bacterium]
MTNDHTALLTQITDALLEVCDGAQERDYQGFNKPDSLIVRGSYPDMKPIAPLLLKYKKQIEAAGFNFNALKEAVIAVSGALPTWNWSEYKLGFGKHAERNYEEMADSERDYLAWMVNTFNHDDQRWIAANAVLSEQPIPEHKAPEPQDETIRLVSFKSGMIGVQAPFSEKDRCKALSERRWEKPYWVCPAAIIEEVAAAFPDGEQSDGFKRRLAEVYAVTEKATATESDFSLEHFGNGKEMMPFQRAGLEFAEATGGNCLISDSMGLGKTVEALSYLALHPEMRPAVIVCPASLKLNWQREAEAWLEEDDRIEVINGGKVHELDADIVIINYDILKKWLPELQRIEPQIFIADESHAVKNKKAARSKAAKELADTIPHKILLTGTPVLNRPEELWHQLQIIDPDSYPDKRFFQWHKRYADAKQLHFGRKTVWDFSGASNLEELAASLKTIMIRRTKDQVLKELPAKRRSTVLIPIDNRKEYDRADKEFLEWMTEQKGAEAAERASHVEQLAKIEYLRQIAVKGKMKQALAWIENFLASGEKLVVFATHKATIDTLVSEFSECAVKIDGSASSERRQAVVDSFQNDPETRLFVGNIQAAGVGITLTAASNVVFLELGWTPALHDQAEDRCHRIGQDSSVNIYYLMADKTIDASIAAMLESKREVIDQITEDENALKFDLFELLEGDE